MKQYIVAIILLALMSCDPVYAISLECLHDVEKGVVVCREESHNKSIAGTVGIFVVRVGTAVIADLIKDAIIKKYYEQFGMKIKPANITLLR